MEAFLENRLAALNNLDPKTTAILGVHWQVDVVQAGGAVGVFAASVAKSGIIQRTANVIDAGRKAGMTIVFVNVAYRPGYTDLIRNCALFNSVPTMGANIRGTPGAAVISELAPRPTDFIIEHTRLSSFYGTDLETLLRRNSIKTVIVTGVATNVAVEQTVRDAVQIGYDTILLEDCCCSSKPEYHEASLMTMRILATEVTTSDAFLKSMRLRA